MIDGLDVFTFIVLAVLFAVAAFLFMKLGELPGKIANENNHPQSKAITICGWLGVITLGLLWPIAIIWAYTRPADSGGGRDNIDLLRKRIDVLEEQLQSLNQDKEHSPQ